MNDKIFNRLWTAALEYEDGDQYVSDFEQELLTEIKNRDKRTTYLAKLWTVARRPLRDMLEEIGLKPKAFSTRYCIPYRTVQAWTSPTEGVLRPCPDWVRLMIAREHKMF